jgi:hypothetical protein
MIRGQRLHLEHVEARPGDIFRPEGLGQVGEVHDHAPPHIDQEGRALHPVELGPPEHLLSVRRVRGADSDPVGPLQEDVELGRAQDRLEPGDPWQSIDLGIEADNLHVER